MPTADLQRQQGAEPGDGVPAGIRYYTIFDAVTYSLFGHHRGGSQGAHELINKDSRSLTVEFEFKADQQLFRLRRTLRRNPKGNATGTQQIAEWRPGGPDDVLLLHFALPSPLSPAFREYRGRRILLHHNITPPEYFLGWDDELARICRVGREELATLAAHCTLGLADSEEGDGAHVADGGCGLVFPARLRRLQDLLEDLPVGPPLHRDQQLAPEGAGRQR